MLQTMRVAEGDVDLYERHVNSQWVRLLDVLQMNVRYVTGEGLTLAFRQAGFLATALASGDISAYEDIHCRLGRMPRLMARLLLLMDASDGFRRCVMRLLACRPCVFNYLLGVHIWTPIEEDRIS
jgi:hypothetical protein